MNTRGLYVGAGSAGCVLAARLGQDPHRRVALVEAGQLPDDPELADPLRWPALRAGACDWAYRTVPPRHVAFHHPSVGTCRMGASGQEAAVVDPSVLPTHTRGQVRPAMVTVAERAGGLIAGRRPLPAARA